MSDDIDGKRVYNETHNKENLLKRKGMSDTSIIMALD